MLVYYKEIGANSFSRLLKRQKHTHTISSLFDSYVLMIYTNNEYRYSIFKMCLKSENLKKREKARIPPNKIKLEDTILVLRIKITTK